MKKHPVIETIIGLMAILSIIMVSLETLVTLSSGWLTAIYIIDLLICAVFIWDFIVRLRSAEDKKHFWKFHGYEILAVIPAYALYLVGSIPAISIGFRALRLIRIVLLIARTTRFFQRAGSFIQRSRLTALFVITLCIVLVAAFIVLMLESDTASPQITNYSDAIWWSLSTVTTVGYGDIVPHSITGRIVGMLLMIVGIGVMAAFISQVSATIVEGRLRQSHHEPDIKMKMKIHIKESIDGLDKLTDEEMVLLIKMIETLRHHK